MSDLADQFGTAGSDVTTLDGRDVRSFIRLQVASGDVLEIARLTSSRLRPQGLRLEVTDGTFVVASTRSPEVSLWSDTAPRKVRVRVECESSTTLDIWNTWRHAGIESSWTGNAGIVIRRDQSKYTLQCSDGVGEVDFTDLVVTVHALKG